MKKIISFLFLLVALSANAATVEKSTTLWSGTQVCTDSWSGYVKLQSSLFSNLSAGDRLEIVVTELSSTCSYPQVMLNTSSWTAFDDQSSIQLKDLTLPASVRFTFTESDVETIKSGGLVVKGCGFTMTTISLITDVETGDPDEKGDYATRIWEGEEVISWTSGSSNWVKIAADKFANAKVGNKVRMNFTNLQMSAQGRILNGSWKKWDDAPTVSPLSGVYYEYTITETMLTDMQASGMIVSGIRFTLTSVDIIDTSKQWLVTSEYDQSDIRAWLPDEQPKFTFKLKNLETVDVTVSLALSISTDTWTHLKDLSDTVTLSAGESRDVALEYTVDPGFYRLTATANGELVAAYTVGYDPENVLSPSDAQSDFATYWNEAKEELAGVKPEYKIVQEMTDYSTSNRKVYLVEMKSTPDSVGGTPVTIRGYYAEPVGEGTYPAVIHFQGTDGGKSTPWCMGGDDNPEWCELIISTRGQMLNNRDPYKADNVYGSDYYSYGFYDKHKHYYRGAYLDCVRAMDFMQSHEKVDKQNVFAAGGSQGGAFCYALAGLDQRVRAIAPSITGHSDFPDDVKIVNWPGNKFTAARDTLGITDDQMFAFLSYYDVKNFAPYVECPVITAFSLQDTTDPPHVNVAPYNNLSQIDAADKEYIVNPFLGHSTHSGWSDQYMEFFAKHKYTAPTTGISADNMGATFRDSAVYTLSGVRINSRNLPAGIYLQGGKKFIVR